MAIAKYTSAKGLYEYEDANSGFFVEDAALIENQQTLAIVKDVTTITCVDDKNKDTSQTSNGGTLADTGELIGDYFYLVAADGSVFYVWYDDAQNKATDPNTANALGAGFTGIEVVLSDDGADNAATVAQKTAYAIDADANFFAQHTGAVITVTPISPGYAIHGDTSVTNKALIESVIPASRTATNGAGTVTVFTIAHAQASKHTSSMSITNYGATSFSCATDMVHAVSNSLAYSTTMALADGSYSGQKKFLYQSAAGAQTTDGILITGLFANAAGAAKTSILFNAVNEFIMLKWNGASWSEMAKAGVTFP